MRVLKVLSVLAIGLVLARIAEAHHSFAPFDEKRQIAFAGTVTDFKWTNPHVYISIDAKGESGEVQHWLIECANTTILNRVGWRWNMIKTGDQISVIVSPLRNGDPAALLKRVRLADGQEFDNGGPAGPATIDFDGKPLAAPAKP